MKKWPLTFLYTVVLCSGLAGIITSQAQAVDDPQEQLANPRQEQRAVSIGQQLRCLVCQNENIEDSSAPLARDLRHIVREQVAQGRSNAAILHWMTERYGNFIRLKPPFSASTAALWLMPVLALIAGIVLATRLWAAAAAPPPPLTPEERARLDQLLDSSIPSEDYATKEHTG